MRDHRWIDGQGQVMWVADMPTSEIVDALQTGVQIIDEDDGTTADNVVERLRIELVARKLEGRT